ncbi:MAG TPA: hypothetical protein VKA18_12485 [Alphaproteobacteria bacterium]|nr:hypothetical protein [Alphaproteobacteria bacterium]
MEAWMRRLLMLPVVVLMVIALVGAIGSSRASGEGDAEGIERDRPFGLDYIPLHSEEGRKGVRAIVIRHQGDTYRIETKEGIEVVDQNRLPLSDVPLVGQLVKPTYSREDFRQSRKIAPVVAGEERLLVDLPASVPLPEEVVVVNRTSSYHLRGGMRQMKKAVPVGGQQIGTAYAGPEPGELLILVRPTVITDSVLF